MNAVLADEQKDKEYEQSLSGLAFLYTLLKGKADERRKVQVQIQCPAMLMRLLLVQFCRVLANDLMNLSSISWFAEQMASTPVAMDLDLDEAMAAADGDGADEKQPQPQPQPQQPNGTSAPAAAPPPSSLSTLTKAKPLAPPSSSASAASSSSSSARPSLAIKPHNAPVVLSDRYERKLMFCKFSTRCALLSQ